MNDREKLRRFLENGAPTPVQMIRSFRKTDSATLTEKSKEEPLLTVDAPDSSNTFPAYTGKNPIVKKIRNYLANHPHPALSAALIHGSIAVGEENGYSDFDGILIAEGSLLRSAVEKKAFRKVIQTTNRLMLEQDALQHHGWQVVFTEELRSNEIHTIVPGVWKTCRCFYPEHPPRIPIPRTTRMDFKEMFRRLSDSISRKMGRQERFNDQYFFKNLCSEILLLPSLYLQSTGHILIEKKESFRIIVDHFSMEELRPLLKVSSWRERWSQRKKSVRTDLFHRLKRQGIYLSVLSPKTQPEILAEAVGTWPEEMNSLIKLMNLRSG